MKKPRILITGFGPFPGMADNPSARIVAHLRAHFPGTFHTRILPTEYRQAPRAFANACKMIRPDIAICLGVAASTKSIRIEQIARNDLRSEWRDAKGERPEGGKVNEAGPECYSTLLPVMDIIKALDDAEIEWSISNNAGGYVCNALFYHAVHGSFTTGMPKTVGFIHVPVPDSDGMSEERLVDAVRLIARACTPG
jgi:pyroglutamyl-peptidase